jgi:hypothetical protein
MRVDIWIENLVAIFDVIKKDSLNSMTTQINNINNINTGNLTALKVKSNGGSFVSLNSNSKNDKLSANVDVCVSNSFCEIGMNAPSSLSLAPYIRILNTLFIGFINDINNNFTSELKNKINGKMPAEFFNCKKERQMSMIVSLGDCNSLFGQIGIKNNKGLIGGINYMINEKDMIHVKYDEVFSFFVNMFGLYAYMLDTVKFGFNISRFIPLIVHNNLSLNNIVLGYGSNGFFISGLLNIMIDALGLYMVIEVVYETEVKINIRIHQASSELKEIEINNNICNYFNL